MSVPWQWPPPNPNDGGAVDSVFGRTGVVVAEDGDYLGSQITNDSSVPGGTVTEALDVIKSNYLSAYIRPPVTPNAFDDEFESGSPDLATRGYTVVTSAGVALTRSGDISPWGTAPVGNTYFSTIIDSWIYLQAAPGVQIDFYKTISLSAGDSYFCRMAGTYNLATNVNGRFNEFGVYAASGAALDGNNRVFNTVRDDTTTTFLIYDAARLTAGASAGATGRTALGGHDIRGVHFVGGTDYDTFYLDAATGEPKSYRVTGAPASATLTRVGLRNLFGNGGTLVPQIWGIDFIRKKTANAWLIP